MQALIGRCREPAEFEAIQKENRKKPEYCRYPKCKFSKNIRCTPHWAMAVNTESSLVPVSQKARQVYEEYHMPGFRDFIFIRQRISFYQADILQQGNRNPA